MNALLEASHDKAQTANPGHDDVGAARKATQISPSRGRPTLRWLWATARTIDAQRDDLVRMHWKKIRRSMLAD